jgi:hypothetical protein
LWFTSKFLSVELGALMTIRILVCLAGLLCAVSAFGQDMGSAALSGEITDPAGAVVVGAEVTAQSKATGLGAFTSV